MPNWQEPPAADPEGFLIGYLGKEPVCCISVVRYEDTFGFLGFYIVKPEMRGRGYGYLVWQAELQRLEGRTVGLDGVVAQQDNYRRSGFVLAHRNMRFGGRLHCERPQDSRLTLVGPALIEELIRYDRTSFPASRFAFLRCWLEPQRRRALALIEEGSVRGYGVIRACRIGFKIGLNALALPLLDEARSNCATIPSTVRTTSPVGRRRCRGFILS